MCGTVMSFDDLDHGLLSCCPGGSRFSFSTGTEHLPTQTSYQQLSDIYKEPLLIKIPYSLTLMGKQQMEAQSHVRSLCHEKQ